MGTPVQMRNLGTEQKRLDHDALETVRKTMKNCGIENWINHRILGTCHSTGSCSALVATIKLMLSLTT
jgi:hypothetical protein